MPASRYWRVCGISTVAGGNLELSELQFYSNGLPESTATVTASHAPSTGMLSNLRDGSVLNTVTWPSSVYGLAGFNIQWDAGVGNTFDFDGVQMGAGSSADTFLRTAVVQYSQDAATWTTELEVSDPAYPGAFALTPAPVDSDPNFISVSLLLRGAGAAGSTEVIDSSLSNKYPSVVVGAARSTAQSKSGGASIYFPGPAPTMVLYPWSSDLHLDGDFTIEFWFYPEASAAPRQDRIVNMGGGINIGWPSYQIAFNHTSATPYLQFCASSTNAGLSVGSETGTAGRIGQVAEGVWQHVAVTRSGDTWRGFINGVLGFTETSAEAPYSSSPRGLQVGGRYDYVWGSGTPIAPTSGYLYGLRITKGLARYTATFTPPVSPDGFTRPFADAYGSFIPRVLTTAPAPEHLLPATALPVTTATGHLREYPFFDAYNGGLGTVSGTVKEKNTPANTPLARRVLLIDEASRMAIREVWSDAVTGAFEFRGVKQGVKYSTISYDHLRNYRAVIADNQDAT
jgi:hypothetical protein